MSKLEAITDNEFKNTIEGNDLVLVDFWAPWCGPCKILAPVLEELQQDMTGIKIVKMDVEANPDTAGKFNIRSIPTLILFKKGEKVDTKTGVVNKAPLKEWIEGYQ